MLLSLKAIDSNPTTTPIKQMTRKCLVKRQKRLPALHTFGYLTIKDGRANNTKIHVAKSTLKNLTVFHP
jgi:hypothetical protein